MDKIPTCLEQNQRWQMKLLIPYRKLTEMQPIKIVNKALNTISAVKRQVNILIPLRPCFYIVLFMLSLPVSYINKTQITVPIYFY